MIKLLIDAIQHTLYYLLFFRKKVQYLRFKRVYVEITNICNLRCSFCPPSERNNQFMTLEAFSHILEKIKNFTEYLYLHVKGEPLLHPDLGLFLDMCNENNIKVNITTNGTLINSIGDMLLTKPAIRQISFSLQSIENIQASKEKELYLRNIIEFSKRAINKTNMYIEFRLWNIDNDIVNRNSNILSIIEEELKITRPLIEQVNKNKGTKLIDRIYLSQNMVFDWPDINKEVIEKTGYCYGLKQQIAVLVDGTVVPCCLDSEGIVSLGNIFVESLEYIMNKKRTKKMLGGFSKKELIEPLCQRCGYRKKFS